MTTDRINGTPVPPCRASPHSWCCREGGRRMGTMGRPHTVGTPPDTAGPHLQAKLQAAGPGSQPGPRPHGEWENCSPRGRLGARLSVRHRQAAEATARQSARARCPSGDACVHPGLLIPPQRHPDPQTPRTVRGETVCPSVGCHGTSPQARDGLRFGLGAAQK